MVNQLLTEIPKGGDDRPLALGDNKPPTSAELLATELLEVYGPQLKGVEPLAKRATDAPEKIESDRDLQAWTAIAVDAAALWKALDTARLNEQRPLTATFKNVFGPTLERLQRITDAAREKANVYNRAKLARERAEREEKLRETMIAAEFEERKLEPVPPAPKPADVARVRGDGGMSTVNTVWKFEVVDYSKVDLNAIRMFIATAEIDKAIRKIVGIQKGATKIEGVRVYEEADTQFRR